jgi:stearoyl-CoA desaturase (Delta-9 desaturase)
MSQSTTTFPHLRVNLDIVIPYACLHLACLAVFWTGITWSSVGLCLGSYWLRGVGVGLGYHRYFAHRSFKTSRGMQFFLALLGAMSLQRGVLWWAETHRYHHRWADTPNDLHSPTYHGFLYSHSGWFMYQNNRQTDLSKVTDLAKFPELVWLDDWRCHYIPFVLYAFAVYLIFGWTGLVWGIVLSTVLLWHSVHWIQSMSHTYGGYRRFSSADNSRNHWLFGLISLGEYHNNHHYYPSSCRQGFAWWEIDINYYLLKIMSWMGLVWDLRTPPDHVRQGKMQDKTLPT